MKNGVAKLTIVCISLTIICMFTDIGYAKVDLTSFVGIWSFDEGEGKGIKDSSGKGNNGEFLVPNFPKWVEGKIGKALSFDGSKSVVKVPDSPSLDITDAITIVAWIKTKKVEDQQVIVAKWKWSGANQRSYFLGHGPYAWLGQDRILKMILSPDGAGGSEVQINSDSEIPIDKWTHVAGVWDGSEVRMYINGKQDGTPGKYNQKIFSSTAFLEFGSQDEGGFSFLNGLIDEVGISNKALTENDIKEIMSQGFFAVSPAGKLAITWGSIKAQK